MKLASTLPGLIKAAAQEYSSKFPGRIREVDDERGAEGNAPFWVYTEPGWCVDPDCHTRACDDTADVLSALSEISPCSCEQCQKETQR